MYNNALHNLSERVTGTSPHALPTTTTTTNATNATNGASWDAERLYVGGSLRQLQHVALHGFSSWPECGRTLHGRAVHVDEHDWGQDTNAPIVLYTDPMLAVEASAAAQLRATRDGTTSNGTNQETDGTKKKKKTTTTTEDFTTGVHAVHTVLLCRLDLGRRHTLYGSRAQAFKPTRELAAQIPPECHTGMVRNF
jgi:hypothetical protein